MSEQLKKLFTNSMYETMCPSLSTLVKVCLLLPVRPASVKRAFSHLKKDKNLIEESPGRS